MSKDERVRIGNIPTTYIDGRGETRRNHYETDRGLFIKFDGKRAARIVDGRAEKLFEFDPDELAKLVVPDG